MMRRNDLKGLCNCSGALCKVTRMFNQGQLTQLSGCECSVISKHLCDTFEKFELAKASHVQIFHMAGPDRLVKGMPASRLSSDVDWRLGYLGKHVC